VEASLKEPDWEPTEKLLAHIEPCLNERNRSAGEKKREEKMNNQIEIYQTKDNQTQVEVQFREDSVWLSQKQMAQLFDRNRVAITQHIGNIFKEGELDKNSVCKDFLHTAKDGKQYNTTLYNLDVIISVGYRVKSQRGTQFQQAPDRYQLKTQSQSS